MKPCAQCGAVCTDNAMFCTACGASLAPGAPSPSAEPAVSAVASTQPVSAEPPQPVPPTQPQPVPSARPQQIPPAPPVQPPTAVPGPPPYAGMPGYGQIPPSNPYGQPQPPYPGAPSYGQPPYQPYPYPNQTPRKRTAPTVLGIIGIVFGILLPLVTYCCSIPGLVMANQDIRQGIPNQSARTLNIVALVIAVVNSLFSIFMNSLLLF